MSNFSTVNEVVRSGIISGGLLRRMVKEKRCPGVYSGTRFYVNVPLLQEQLIQESQPSKGDNEGEKYVPKPVRMETKGESLKRSLCDEASRLNGILEDLFMSYQNDYAEEARFGLSALSEVISTYENFLD